MHVSIKIQHLACIKEVRISPLATLESLKSRIEELFAIPAALQALFLDDRNLTHTQKPLSELGIQHGSVITVKKIHRFSGARSSADITSMMKNPIIKSMIKNPETIKTIQEMFPDLKEEMGQNKTLSMIINSGGLEEELERMTMDSDYMSTQLRNADVMMAKLENIPGGINMMSGMLQEIEDPFRNLQGAPGLIGGEQIASRIRSALPGQRRQNALVDYRRQLMELRDIGFDNVSENVEVLTRVQGDLQAALDILAERHQNRNAR